MQINFTGHGLEITPAMKEFTAQKFKRLDKYLDIISSVRIKFSIEKLEQVADATIHVTKKEIHAASKARDLYTAIDDLVDKLHGQLIEYKEKLTAHRE